MPSPAALVDPTLAAAALAAVTLAAAAHAAAALVASALAAVILPAASAVSASVAHAATATARRRYATIASVSQRAAVDNRQPQSCWCIIKKSLSFSIRDYRVTSRDTYMRAYLTELVDHAEPAPPLCASP